MKNNETLKPCPFHKINEDCEEYQFVEVPFPITILGEPKPYFQIRCVYCGARGPSESSKEEAIAAWNKRAGETNGRDKKIIEWFVNGDSGVSSRTLCACFYGIPPKEKWDNHPRDPSDFARCVRFLDLLSPGEKKTALRTAAAISPQWKALIEKWEYLERFYGCENLFAEMQKIIKGANRDG